MFTVRSLMRMKSLAIFFFALSIAGNTLSVFCFANASSRAVVSACPSNPPCPRFAYNTVNEALSLLWGTMQHPMKCSRSAYDFHEPLHQREMSSRLNELLSQVVGQDHAINPIKKRLIVKIARPSEPLVFLLTGDNGVGKTMTANLISLALSLRCGSDNGASGSSNGMPTNWGSHSCLTGDAAISFTASESNFEIRDSIVKRIADHAYKFPRGVVIINEVLLLNPKVLEHLAPLFGRGRSFFDHPHAPLNELTVILTSDFGKHAGITQGKTAKEVAQYSREVFAKKFGMRFVTEMTAHAFLPLSYGDALAACKQFIFNLPCRIPAISSVDVDDDVIERIVGHLVTAGLADNNAREVVKFVESTIDATISGILLTKFPVGARDVSVNIYLKNNPQGKSNDNSQQIVVSVDHHQDIIDDL